MKTFNFATDPLPDPEPFPCGTFNGRSLGQWNAWAAAVPEDMQATRLAQVPEPLRDQVRRHLDTVNAIRWFYGPNADRR